MHPKVAETNHLSLVSPIQLAAGDQVVGTIFRKQIMSYGRWVNPNWWWDEELWMDLTEEIADQMIDNFNKKTFGKRISVPLNHTGDVTANAGEVIKLEKGPGGLWAYLDIRRTQTVEDIDNGLVFDVSMGFDLDYVDQKTMDSHGAVLIHVALVTDPYLNDMDDFSRQENKAELSRKFDAWAEPLSQAFGKNQKSIIMMSKANVEEFKRMKFAKVVNDKDYEVKVTYKDADGKEVESSIAAGAELEVPAENETSVKEQIESSTAPVVDDPTPADPAGDEPAPAPADPANPDDPNTGTPDPQNTATQDDEPANEDEKQELARLRKANAELEADKKYTTLAAAGKIVPAQRNLFTAFAKAGGQEVTLDADVMSADGKTKLFAKGDKASVVTMLSAILEAGPKLVKFGEKGGQGEAAGDDPSKVELTQAQEAKLKKMGFSVETFKKQLAKGNIKLSVLEEN